MEALKVIVMILICLGAALKMYYYLNGPKKKVVCSTCRNFHYDGENKVCLGTFNRTTLFTWENESYAYTFPPSEINKNNDCKHYSEAMLTGGYQPKITNNWPDPPAPPPKRFLSEDVNPNKLFKKGKR